MVNLPNIKIKSPVFILSFLLFFVITAITIVPKSNWKNLFNVNRFATVFTTSDTLYDRAVYRNWTAGGNAWGENVGWLTLSPNSSSMIYIADDALSGYLYGENIGWISLSCRNTNCGLQNYGVSNDTEGNLSGRAWGENVGWIDFGSSTSPYQVIISAAGTFSGYAYGENIGFINFGASSATTTWTPRSLRAECDDGIDNDSSGQADYPSDINCSSLTDDTEIFARRTPATPTDTTDPTTSSDTTATTTTSDITTATTTATSTTSSLPAEFCFNKNLSPHTLDPDVKNLQIFLNNKTFLSIPSGSETDYYGTTTINAIISFQEYYASEILEPSGLTEGTGNFGDATRKKVNDILGCETTTEIAEIIALEISTTTSNQESTSSENVTPEVVVNTENQTPIAEEQNNNTPQNTSNTSGTSAGMNVVNVTEPNQNSTFSNLSESIKQSYENTSSAIKKSYEQTAVVVKESIKKTKEVVNSPTGSVVTKSIATGGVVVGASAYVSAVAFATPVTFSELWLVPAKLFGLLMGALGIRRKNRPWGTVYDSITKRPLDPVYVSLINIETNKEVGGVITDIDGRYGFLVLPGKYRIEVKKTNYISPSKTMAGKAFDEVYNDLYFGETLTIEKEGETITKNIPMDSLSFDWNEFAKTKMNVNTFMKSRDITWAKISKFLFSIGAVVSLVAMILAPAPYNLLIAGFYILVYILNYIVFNTKKAGTLLEKNTRIPLSFAIVKIFREGEDAPLVKKIADKFGAYYALLPNGRYYIKIDKKEDDASYSEVLKTEIMEIKTGIININFII